VLLPATISTSFFLKRQRFESAITLLWTAQSLLNVSVYVRDARRMALQLIGGA
jgi:hypothetical protein